MSLAPEDVLEIRSVAAARWPADPAASDAEIWAEWLKSLDRFEFVDVMAAVILLGETSERFPALARLIIAIQVAHDERIRANRPLLDAPKAASTIAIRLEQFDRSMVEDRIRRHTELAMFVRAHGDAPVRGLTVAERHQLIDDVGPWEAKAREWVARGVDPGEGARAFVAQFVANAAGDPDQGVGMEVR